MKTPQKISQKGMGLLEYALMFGFVAAVFLIAMVWGGFGDTVGDLFGGSSESLANVKYESDTGTSDSSLVSNASTDSAETSSNDTTADGETETKTYPTRNWQEIIEGVTKSRGVAESMYGTIIDKDSDSNSPDKSLVSEINLFGQILEMTEGYLSSTKAEDGLKDWQTFMSRIEKLQKQYNFKSSYKRGEETVSIERIGNSNAVQIKYTDKENVIYYKLSPDANNVMQVETNSGKSYSEFFKSIKTEKGWEYSD